MKNKELGKLGEDFAVEYLKKHGFEILERNWHYSRNAEIDIIAKDKNTLVFVEVKTRSGLNCGHPFEAINKEKIRKIAVSIPAYIEEKQLNCTDYRIDIIALIGKQNPKLEHLRGIGY